MSWPLVSDSCTQLFLLAQVSLSAASNRACNAIPTNGGVELSDERFRRGQRSRNAMDGIRVARFWDCPESICSESPSRLPAQVTNS